MRYANHDDALISLAGSSPELRNGAPNDAPMVVEAPAALDRGQLAPGWIATQRSRLAEGPRSDAVLGDNRLAAAEHEAIRNLESCAAGELLPLPDLSKALASGDLIAGAMRLHRQNMQTLRGFDAALLDKRVRFPKDHSVWSVTGFLWAFSPIAPITSAISISTCAKPVLRRPISIRSHREKWPDSAARRNWQ